MEMIGLWNLLTDEQKAKALAYEGDETFGAGVEFLRKKAAPIMESGNWKVVDGWEGY